MTVTVFSQTNKEEIEFYKSILRMEKKEVASEFVKLGSEKATAFWVLCDQYEADSISCQFFLNMEKLCAHE